MSGKMIYVAPPPVQRHACAPPEPRWSALGTGGPNNVDPTPGSIWQCDTCGQMWWAGGRLGWYQISERKARDLIKKGTRR